MTGYTKKTTLGQKAIASLAYMILMYPKIKDYPDEFVNEAELFLGALGRAEAEEKHSDDVAAFYDEIENEFSEGFYLADEKYIKELEEALTEIFTCPVRIKEKIVEIAKIVKDRDW